MDPAALAARLEAIDDRAAGTDAERRAAAACAAELRAAGWAPRTRTLWFRPPRPGARALYAALGIAGSVVAVSHAVTGLALVGAALLAVLLESAGLPIVALLLPRRATQNVVASPPGGSEGRGAVAGTARASDDHGDLPETAPSGRVLLILAARADAPGDGLASRVASRLRGRFVPGPTGILAIALAATAGCAAARVAGAEGSGVGVAALVPAVVLLLLLGAFVDEALARPPEHAPAGGPAVAVSVARTLAASPPRALAVEVLIAGAGPVGMRSHVRRRRRELAPEEVVVLELGSAPGGVRYLARDGELFPLSLHPQLIALTGGLPGTTRREDRGRSLARVARGARWPAIALDGEPRALAAAALRLIAAVDREVARGAARDSVGT